MSKYAKAITFRKNAIVKLRAKKPASWTQDYLEINVALIQAQINMFEKLDREAV